MASRYSGFTRSARSAFHAGTRNSFRTANSNTPRNHFAVHSQKRRNFENVAQMFRRRGAQSMVPFHNAVASAKLVSHLAFNSRTCSFHGYLHMVPLALNVGHGV
eukprot:TRINITY_DN964_c0_g1_i3.p2 TRINITY_DN964_c0_g1~~TRINITY_DN964_c0_g1_i3.p2  ORF type:complete len:104 (-),score=7.65 TRINITY_DN964_c0_g1_i3:392-703(-)